MAEHVGQRDNENPFRLVVVSNRLPVTLIQEKKGTWRVNPSSGGLVTALTPVLRNRQGVWIGWSGTFDETGLDEILNLYSQDSGYQLRSVKLGPEEIDQYYLGFSNQILWPLLHDLQSRCNFDPSYWSAYQKVNRKFAEVVSDYTTPNDYIWVHDYQLMLLSKELHNIGVKQNIGFFFHTPFPPLDICVKLPWHPQVLKSLLEYDLLGFQTFRDRSNFLHCIASLMRGIHFDARKQVSTIELADREIKAGVFPISIDFDEFAKEAKSGTVTKRANQLRQAVHDRQIVLGVDRLDYSKGIPEKLKAFGNALERFDDLADKITLIQIVVPSREDISEYQDLKSEIEGLVGEINGRCTLPGWVPVHYMFRNLKRSELLAYYRAADIALITPLKDGMNLICKEYCASKVDSRGVLILSQFAGAAFQLSRDAILVHPYDVEGMAEAIYRAYHMDDSERQLRMRRLRKNIRKRDIFWWLNAFLDASEVRI
jgi:trehalose 6-phosphate synthase